MSLEENRQRVRVPLAIRTLRSAPSDITASPEIVFLHGFSQNSLCMGPLSSLLSGPMRLRAVDLPGHGLSRVDPPPDLWTTADLVATTSGRATYIGYSMGGRVALHLALAHPESVEGLVLIGATAGIEDSSQRQLRRLNDAELADRLEMIGIEQFVQEWLNQPLFAGLPAWARFDAERGTNEAFGLADSLRLCGTGSMEPLWARLKQITCPVLVLAGELDSRYCTIGSRMASGIGDNASFEVITGAGHSVHLEQPGLTAAAVNGFLGLIPA